MRLLVDTSAYSAFLRGHEGARRDVEAADSLAVTPIVLGELLAEFRKGTHPRDRARPMRPGRRR